MADISIALHPQDLSGDWSLVAGDLATGDDLETAILVSLLTEQGWWADSYEAVSIGSRLLELRRAKHIPDTLLRARDYCRQALAWLVQDRVARSVEVTAEWQAGSRLAIGILLVKPTGGRVQFSWVWDAV